MPAAKFNVDQMRCAFPAITCRRVFVPKDTLAIPVIYSEVVNPSLGNRNPLESVKMTKIVPAD